MFGLAPALRASAVEAARVLKEESQTGGLKKSRMRSALVVAQMAMCVVLLAGAALCVRSLMNADAIDAGFDTHHIALATLDPGSLGYSPEKVDGLLLAAAGAGGASARSDFGELRRSFCRWEPRTM